jgi:hypothetical protein
MCAASSWIITLTSFTTHGHVNVKFVTERAILCHLQLLPPRLSALFAQQNYHMRFKIARPAGYIRQYILHRSE